LLTSRALLVKIKRISRIDVRFCGTDNRLNAFPFNSKMVSPPVQYRKFALEFYNPKGEHHVEESRTYLRSCRLCCSALHNTHIAGTFGNIRHRGVCWSGTSLLWSLSTRRSTNLPAQLLLSPLLLIACVRHEATLADTNNGSPTCKGGGSCTRQQDRTE